MTKEELMNKPNWGTADIAAYIGLDRTYVTNTLTKEHGFPEPVANHNQKVVRWDIEAVVAFLATRKKTRKKREAVEA